MTFMSTHGCILGTLVLLMAGLSACDTVEERISPTGEFEATTLMTAVQVRTPEGADSTFFVDLLEAGGTLELRLLRQDTARVFEGRLVLPEGTFADSFFVPVLPERDRSDSQSRRRNTPSPASVDGIDTTFTGTWVHVQSELFLGLHADTSAPDVHWPVPTSYDLRSGGDALHGRTNARFETRTDTMNAYQVILQRK